MGLCLGFCGGPRGRVLRWPSQFPMSEVPLYAQTTELSTLTGKANQLVDAREATRPRFFDELSGSAVGAIDYVRGSGN